MQNREKLTNNFADKRVTKTKGTLTHFAADGTQPQHYSSPTKLRTAMFGPIYKKAVRDEMGRSNADDVTKPESFEVEKK